MAEVVTPEDDFSQAIHLTPPSSPKVPQHTPRLTNTDGSECVTPTVSPSGKTPRKKRNGTLLRKAPQAPKRFKSSYILFFMEKQEQIKAELPKGSSVSFYFWIG